MNVERKQYNTKRHGTIVEGSPTDRFLSLLDGVRERGSGSWTKRGWRSL